MLLRPDVWNRSVKLAVAATVFFAFVLWIQPPRNHHGHRFKSWFSQPSHQWGSYGGPTQTSVTKDGCPVASDADNVVITVKTGASEASARIPTQLRTTLKCPPNILHFSDMEQTVDNVTIHDALAPIPEFVKIGNPDFDLYRAQQARKRLGWHDEPVTEEVKKAAWTLDKYKNLHIVAKSYWLFPDKKWYLHIDADTYLVWSSLLWWLNTLDPSKPLYTGSLTCFGDVKAAHGGSGILLSNSAAKAIVQDNSSTIPSWDGQARDHCCGDELVAQALKDNGIEMHNSWPLINGDTPFTIPFGPQFWCEPVVTMHHLSTKEMEIVAAFEQSRPNRSEPLSYMELFNELVYDHIPETTVDDWDNLSEGITLPDCPSFEACINECNENDGCFQASYDGSECILGTRNFRVGVEKKPEESKKWQSMWNKRRMREWAVVHVDCTNLHVAFKDSFVCG
ncbi:uncharacterized protein PV09_06221 [Verruconis gallopava]|uniref:Apple domain-containing protein n=1 Tax=Verruconis gallopava TaxID=253628 RepID=A0A0D1XJC4_9PEZI|nr:uncharacterized protein PV09_06221 [Verruconis gallopava]KIW02401.1 hypothetical protein PV09_06221 [Verruconis gallopava]